MFELNPVLIRAFLLRNNLCCACFTCCRITLLSWRSWFGRTRQCSSLTVCNAWSRGGTEKIESHPNAVALLFVHQISNWFSWFTSFIDVAFICLKILVVGIKLVIDEGFQVLIWIFFTLCKMYTTSNSACVWVKSS